VPLQSAVGRYCAFAPTRLLILSQVSCNRVQPVCNRCGEGSIECIYSRSGTIRRKRKRKHDIDPTSNAVRPSTVSSSTPASATESTVVQSHLTSDIEATRGLLHGLGASDTSLGALTSLSEACAAVWHNAMEFDSTTSRRYFLFEDQAASWADSERSAYSFPRLSPEANSQV
jgi:hypothetical protein